MRPAGSGWATLTFLVPTGAVPVVLRAMQAMELCEGVRAGQALELLCADYLAGEVAPDGPQDEARD